jgi:methyl coenzyme M reductase beta subunit
MDGQIEKRTRDQMTQAQALGETARVATARYEALDARLTVIGEGSRTSIDTMSERMDAMERRLVEADRSVGALTEASVRLLELVQASARYTSQELPASLGQSESRLADYGGRVAALTENMARARASGEALAEHVTSAEGASPMRRTRWARCMMGWMTASPPMARLWRPCAPRWW